MANHCIDVICLGCGAGWCVRGCRDRQGPSEARKASYLKHAQEWADRFAKGKVRHTIMEDDRCYNCKNSTVVME